jgi:hypothetical protein
MFAIVKALWGRLAFWRTRPIDVDALIERDKTVDYWLDNYKTHYENYQRQFLYNLKQNDDPLYWKTRTIEEISVLGCQWNGIAYSRNPAHRVHWWTLDETGNAIKQGGSPTYGED